MKIKITDENGIVLKTAGKLCEDDIVVIPDESILGGEPNLQDKTVNPKKTVQTITADEGYDGLGTVVVSGAELYSREIYPTGEDKEYTPYYGIGFSKVVVKAVTADVDSNIQPAFIKKGVTILGVTGVYEGETAGFTVSMSSGGQTATVYDGQTATGTGVTIDYTTKNITCTSGYLLVTTGSANYVSGVGNITGDITGEEISYSGSGYNDRALLYTVKSDGSILNIGIYLD